MTGGGAEADPAAASGGVDGTGAAAEGVAPGARVGVLEGATEIADGGLSAGSAWLRVLLAHPARIKTAAAADAR